MKVDSYKPLSNLVLVKHVYEIPALAMPKVKETFGEYLKDRVLVAMSSDVAERNPELKEGVCIHTNPNANASAVFFTDNELDVNLVYKQYKLDTRVEPNNMKTYIIHGYFVMPIYDVYAVVNPCSEDPKPKDSKPVILIN